MEKTYKYRIKIEVIGEPNEDDLKMLETAGEGFECDGFTLIGDNADETSIFIHEMSIDDIARLIMLDDHLLQAAILAQAYFNADMAKKEHAIRSMSKLLTEAIKSKGE